MEKLPHERLRDGEDKGGGFVAVKAIDYGQIIGRKLVMESLADEIERCYITRPLDKYGKPWEIDAPCLVNGEECKIAGFDGDGNINVEDGDSNTFFWIGEGYVKRPTPKVYDADDVEIKVGDYGYGLIEVFDDRDDMLKVERINANAIEVSRANGGVKPVWIDSSEFTHEKPVFDADGVRICKDDTDYWTIDGRHVEVLQIGPYQGGKGCIVRNDNGFRFVVEGKDLTHREPDSVIKVCNMLSQYARADLAYSASQLRDAASNAVDRLTSLIERGA